MKQLLETTLNKNLISLIVSNPRLSSESTKKIKIRPINLGNNLHFQLERFKNNQAFHENLSLKDCIAFLTELIEYKIYKQMNIITTEQEYHILFNKKGKAHINEKAVKRQNAPLNHNRKKTYLLPENEPVDFLIHLSIMTREGKVIQKKYDKFKQINRYLEMVDDVFPQLEKLDTINIIDFGCGKSYLTFALYYYLVEQKGQKVNIIGLDLKDEVIDTCNRLSKELDYSALCFEKGNIHDYNDHTRIDMVVTLHACDTATDMALLKAVKWNAKVILSVPCCQHELNASIQCDPLKDILKYGIIKERVSALFTDAIRANWLESAGYEVQILEFIDMAHTPKNLLIRAVKKVTATTISSKSLETVNALEDYFNTELYINHH